MSKAAALPLDETALGPPERLHPLYLLTGLPQSLRGAWGLLAGGVLLASQDKWWIAVLMVAGFFVVSIGSLLIRWLKLEYRVGAHELRIDSGWLNRTSRAIPFDRVTDVDLEQGPLHRLFGLARVRLETGASAGANGEDGVLHTIALARAEALREHIRSRRDGPADLQISQEIEAVPLFSMDNRRVACAGWFNFSLAVIAGLFGVTQTMGDVIGFDPFRRVFWADLLERSEPLQRLVMTHQIVAIIGGSILLLLLGVGTGLVRTFLREYRFRLDRTESGLRRRRGLLTLTDVTIPARRVQAAILATGPVRKYFGWRVLKLQSLAMDGGKGDHVVAPLATELEAAAILCTVQGPITPASGDWRHVSRAYVSGLAWLLIPAALIATLLGMLSIQLADLSGSGAVPLAGPIFFWIIGAASAVAFRWLSWRQTRFALDDRTLFVETGWWRHRRTILPIGKIQSVDIAENFWSRLFGVCTLRLGVAGGGGFSDHHIPALARDEATSLRAQLLSR